MMILLFVLNILIMFKNKLPISLIVTSFVFVLLFIPHQVYAQNRDPLPTQSQGCNPNSENSNPHCQSTEGAPISVPEFGLIPGALASLSSAGLFLALKRKAK